MPIARIFAGYFALLIVVLHHPIYEENFLTRPASYL